MKRIAIALLATFVSFISLCEIKKGSQAAFSISQRDSRLPYECEVEWLESTGIQYILLEDVLANGIDIYVLPEKTVTATSAPFGKWNGGARMDSVVFMTIHNRGWSIQNMSMTGLYTFDMTYEMKHVIVCGTSISIDGAEYSMGNEWGYYGSTSKYCFALFGCYNINAGTVTCQSCKIGRCDIYVNNVLSYSFVPMRVGVGDNAVGYMYEQISGQYYGNQGIGKFIIGPDVRR